MTWRKQIPTKTSICTTNAFKSAPCRHNVISIVPGHIYSASIKKRTQLNPSTVKDHINRRTSKTYIKVFKVNIYSKWLPDNPEITLAACCLRSAADPANDGRRKKKKNTPPPTTQAAQDGGEIIRLSQQSAPVLLLVREITMGSTDSKLNFRKAVIQLTTKTQVSFAPCGHKAKCSLEILLAGARRRASPWR